MGTHRNNYLNGMMIHIKCQVLVLRKIRKDFIKRVIAEVTIDILRINIPMCSYIYVVPQVLTVPLQ